MVKKTVKQKTNACVDGGLGTTSWFLSRSASGVCGLPPISGDKGLSRFESSGFLAVVQIRSASKCVNSENESVICHTCNTDIC